MKVIINQYLRDIGINEDTYWIMSEDHGNDNRYKEDEEGIISAETWNLNTTLAMIIYSYLCYFRDHCMHGYPANITFEKWKEIVNTIIKAFELMLVEDDTWSDLTKTNEEKIKISKSRQKKISYGLRLFAKYFNDFWW